VARVFNPPFFQLPLNATLACGPFSLDGLLALFRALCGGYTELPDRR
jgi:hypothetical protein